MAHGNRFWSREETQRRYMKGEISTFARDHIMQIHDGREIISPGDPSYGVPNQPSVPSQPGGGVSSAPTLGVYQEIDYASRTEAMLGGEQFRSARRAAGILGVPSRTGPVQRVGSQYVSQMGPGLPPPPPPAPGADDYVPYTPPVPTIPGEPRPFNPNDDFRPDFGGNDHNMPFRRRANQLTR